MGCCQPNHPRKNTNSIPLPTSTPNPPSLNHVERPSLRRQAKFQNLDSTISRSNSQLTENVTLIEGSREREQSESYISEVLKSHFFFHSISDSDRKDIIRQMHFCEAQPHSYIFRQNDRASAFFIIHSGAVQVEIAGEPKKSLSRGSYFGELALLYAAPRSASIKALELTRCWCITRGTFRKAMQEILQRNYGMGKSFINKLSIFNFLTGAQKDSIAYSMFILKY